ncbi:MAG: glutamate--tRNA ligase, partial [Alphaproteobacteria bacterium]
QHLPELSPYHREMFIKGMDGIKERAKTLPELLDIAYYFLGKRPFKTDQKSQKFLDTVSRGMLNRLTSRLRDATWTQDQLEEEIRRFVDIEELKLGKIAQPLRVALTGRTVSPSVFEMMTLLGKEECIARLEDASR